MKLYQEIIDSIQDKDISNLCKNIVTTIDTTDKEVNAYNVYNWVMFILKNDKILQEVSYTVLIDVMKAAAIMHNLFYTYNEKDYTKVFLLRQYFADNFELIKNIPVQIIDSICQTVECQLGKNNPISLLIPNPNSPGNQFSLACSIYYKTGCVIPKEK